MDTVTCRRRLLACVAATAIGINAIAPVALANSSSDGNTSTPIKHLIVIYGENRSFDHLFAIYKPQHTETVMNLLSQGIVNPDGPLSAMAVNEDARRSAFCCCVSIEF